jgi:ADP-heptose:LPS heptosyltransferase
MAAGADLGRPLLVAHPGAGARWKEAPSARFTRALESMAADGGFEVVVHQGPADGKAVEALLAELATPAVCLVEPSLTELAGALALAKAYIGSDSGVSHLAACVGTASVILYPPATLRRWAPWSSTAVPLGVGAEGGVA